MVYKLYGSATEASFILSSVIHNSDTISKIKRLKKFYQLIINFQLINYK